MKNEVLVSIIVPIYNAESTIGKCIDSIIKQTYHTLEIVLVDDGSKDRSLQVAQGYADIDKRIKVFHQENKGVSVARNLGITKSSGMYLSFVDADDWINETFIEKLVETIQGADLAIVGFNEIHKETIQVLLGESGYWDKETFFYDILCKIHGACWNKLFVKSIIQKNDIQFESNVYFSEDTLFVMNYYRYCNKVKYLNEALYNYEFQDDSATHKQIYKAFNTKRETMLVLSERIEEWYKQEMGFVRSCIVYRRVRTYIYLIYHMAICNDYKKSLAQQIHKDIGKYCFQFIMFGKTPLIQKIAAIAIWVSPRVTYLLGSSLYRVLGVFRIVK